MTRSLRQRVLAGSGANAFGQVITVGIQLVSLPLFLHYWDAATYGAWLILSAIPSYLSMADAGMVTAAGNKMTVAMGQRDYAQANKVFQSALFFMMLVCGLLSMLVLPAALLMPVPGFSGEFDYRVAVALLSGSILLTLFGGLVDAIFKATARYPLGTMLVNLVRLAEWGGAMLGLALFGTFAAVAAGGFLSRAIGLVLISAAATTGGHGLRWSVQDARLAEVRAMAKPAFSFMLFPLSFALSFQGLTLLIAYTLGPAAVAIFNTYRTLARVSVQATSVFSHALWPEFSRLYGAGGSAAVLLLYRRSFWTSLSLAALLSVILYTASPFLLKIWTHNSIAFDSLLMVVMTIYAAVASAGHVPRTFLSAINRHSTLAIWMTIAALASLLLASLLGKIAGLIGMSIAMLVAEFAITAISISLSMQILRLSGSLFPIHSKTSIKKN